jgi:hypothetical protein
MRWPGTSPITCIMNESDGIEGIVPILPTPFSDKDEVDSPQLADLVDFAVAAGATAVGTPAFGSEFYKLDGAERTQVIETVIAHAVDRLLAARGVLRQPVVRPVTVELSADASGYLDSMIAQLRPLLQLSGS